MLKKAKKIINVMKNNKLLVLKLALMGYVAIHTLDTNLVLASTTEI